MAGELDLVASALRADAGDVDVFFDVLVAKLAQVLPGQVEVQRGGFLGRGKPEAVTVALGDPRYDAARAPSRGATAPTPPSAPAGAWPAGGARSCAASRSRARSWTSARGSTPSRPTS